MPSLAELQRAMRRHLLTRDGAAAAFVVDDGIAALERLAVYCHTFESVAVRALRLNHPAVARLVGDDFFEAAALAYLAERPPASAWLDSYGAGFAGFLARWQPAAVLGYLPDVARLEWSVSRALHAPDGTAPDSGALAALGALDAREQGALRLAAHPSLRLLRTQGAADLIWRATLADDDDALGALDPQGGPRWLLVARTASGIELQALDEAAWRFTLDLACGCALQQALDRLAARERASATSAGCATDAAALLAGHLASGRFTVPGVSRRARRSRIPASFATAPPASSPRSPRYTPLQEVPS